MNHMSSGIVRYIFLGIIAFVLIGLAYTNVAGNKQNEILKEDYLQYNQAIQSIQNKQVESGVNILEKLIRKYPNEYTLYYQLGIAYSAMTDFQKASQSYQKALEIRPALLQDQQFTFKIGEALFYIGELEKSQTYLSMPTLEVFKAQKEQLLQEISNQIRS